MQFQRRLDITFFNLFKYPTGILYEATGSYNAAFYFSGGLILLSAFLCYPLTWVSRWEQRRNEKLTPLPAA